MIVSVYLFLSTYVISIFFLQWVAIVPANILAIQWLLFLVILGIKIIRPHIITTIATFVQLGFTTACCIAFIHRHIPAPNAIENFANTYSTVEGVIIAEPDRRPLQTKYTIQTKRIVNEHGQAMQNTNGKILVTDQRQWPEWQYGDTIIASGLIEKPGLINETFFYDRYLSRYGVYAVMYRGSLQAGTASSLTIRGTIWRTLFAVKELFETQINRIFPEPHASFMAGLLTGSRRGIPTQLMEQFNTTGLTHIIAISGYNITIIITLITGVLFWLPTKYRLLPAIGAIILFTCFVGASAAVVRAAIMGILGLIALHTKRINTARITVLWTIFFMTAYNPKYLWHDAGFQLSFMAVIGLLEISPLLEPILKRIPNKWALREALQLTLAAQISTAPLLLLLFKRLSLIAPITNLLVAPLIPLAMLLGFVGTTTSFIWFHLGQILCYPAWLCLQLIILIANYGSNIPYASADNIWFHWAVSIPYYVGLLCICIWHNKRTLPTIHK